MLFQLEQDGSLISASKAKPPHDYKASFRSMTVNCFRALFILYQIHCMNTTKSSILCCFRLVKSYLSYSVNGQTVLSPP